MKKLPPHPLLINYQNIYLALINHGFDEVMFYCWKHNGWKRLRGDRGRVGSHCVEAVAPQHQGFDHRNAAKLCQGKKCFFGVSQSKVLILRVVLFFHLAKHDIWVLGSVLNKSMVIKVQAAQHWIIIFMD